MKKASSAVGGQLKTSTGKANSLLRAKRKAPTNVSSIRAKRLSSATPNLIANAGNGQTQVWRIWLSAFIQWKTSVPWNKPISSRTQSDYEKTVELFFRRYPQAVNPKCLKECLDAHFSQNIAPATFNLRLVYLRAFFNFLTVPEGAEQEEKYKDHLAVLKRNPIAGRSKRYDEGRIVNIKDEQIDKLLERMQKEKNRDAFEGFRDLVLLQFQIDTGIRPGEALKVVPADLDFAAKNPCVHLSADDTKNRCSRALPLSREMVKTLKSWLAKRKAERIPPGAPLFCTAKGKPMSGNTWYRRLHDYCKDMTESIRPYGIRHYAAMAYYEDTKYNQNRLQAFLGHKTPAMAQRYANYKGAPIIADHDKYSPLNRLRNGNSIAA